MEETLKNKCKKYEKCKSRSMKMENRQIIKQIHIEVFYESNKYHFQIYN